jgi:hypothetical protein
MSDAVRLPHQFGSVSYIPHLALEGHYGCRLSSRPFRAVNWWEEKSGVSIGGTRWNHCQPYTYSGWLALPNDGLIGIRQNGHLVLMPPIKVPSEKGREVVSVVPVLCIVPLPLDVFSAGIKSQYDFGCLGWLSSAFRDASYIGRPHQDFNRSLTQECDCLSL